MPRIEKNWKTIKCLECHKEINIPNWRLGRAKYCSFECSNKHRTTKKSYHNKRICIGCKKEFFPTGWYQKFCSRECFTKSVKKRKRIICKTCGKEFGQARIAQVYCSRECGDSSKRKTFTKIKKNHIDRLWMIFIKLRAQEKCEYCGKTEHLNSHHIFSRSNMGMRWDIDNGVCLCVGHHVFGLFSAHKAPLDFAEWLKEKRGNEWFERLRVKSRNIIKLTEYDKEQIAKNLKEMINDYQTRNKILETRYT
jgi:hypothetical protein